MLLLLAALAFAQDDRVDHIALTGREAILGNPTAPFTIVQYSDWLCPHCARAFDRLDDYVTATSDVKVVFKSYPLTHECNPAVSSSNNGARCTLAYASACANQLGHWVPWARWAFEQQSSLSGATPDTLAATAGAQGMKADKFRKCIDSAEARQSVQADAVEGSRLGLQGTPTLYVKDPAKGDWIKADHGVEGAIALVEDLRNGVVGDPPAEQPPLTPERAP